MSKELFTHSDVGNNLLAVSKVDLYAKVAVNGNEVYLTPESCRKLAVVLLSINKYVDPDSKKEIEEILNNGKG